MCKNTSCKPSFVWMNTMPVVIFFSKSYALDHSRTSIQLVYFFFNYTATTYIYTRPYTLSLHDALPISRMPVCIDPSHAIGSRTRGPEGILDLLHATDRKSTRLNSSHTVLSRMPSS